MLIIKLTSLHHSLFTSDELLLQMGRGTLSAQLTQISVNYWLEQTQLVPVFSLVERKLKENIHVSTADFGITGQVSVSEYFSEIASSLLFKFLNSMVHFSYFLTQLTSTFSIPQTHFFFFFFTDLLWLLTNIGHQNLKWTSAIPVSQSNFFYVGHCFEAFSQPYIK